MSTRRSISDWFLCRVITQLSSWPFCRLCLSNVINPAQIDKKSKWRGDNLDTSHFFFFFLFTILEDLWGRRSQSEKERPVKVRAFSSSYFRILFWKITLCSEVYVGKRNSCCFTDSVTKQNKTQKNVGMYSGTYELAQFRLGVMIATTELSTF